MADKNANPPLPGNTTDGKKGVGEKAVNKRDKKGKGKLLLFIFIVVLILLIAAFLTAHLYFDLFGWKAPMFQLMHRLDPVYVELEDREATLVVGETALGEREAAVEERENSLTIKELQVQKREEELLQMEKNRVPVYRPPVNETDREYMEGIAKLYAAMEPENAADVIVNLYSLEDMAAIIHFMSASKAAGILECLTPQLAAQITDQLINTYS